MTLARRRVGAAGGHGEWVALAPLLAIWLIWCTVCGAAEGRFSLSVSGGWCSRPVWPIRRIHARMSGLYGHVLGALPLPLLLANRLVLRFSSEPLDQARSSSLPIAPG